MHARPVCGYHSRISATEAPFARLLTDNLALLDQIVRRVARRHRLRDDEVDDLSAAIKLKLIDNDYEALRRFEGRSSLAGYLTAIVTRHLLDERNAQWGKWRPSVFARRSGRVAMQLEMLMTRDGLSFSEAVQMLRSTMLVTESEAELYRISVSFPGRQPRRFVPAETLAELPGGAEADAGVVQAERAELAAKVAAALRAACAELDVQDQLLLRMCYERGLQLAAVARALQIEQKPLYRRREHVLAVLRRALEAQGIKAEDVREIVGGVDHEPPVE